MIKENTPTLVTERLILRKFTENDIDDLFLIFSDIEVNKFLPWNAFTQKDEAIDYFFTKIQPCYERDIAYRYAITLKNNQVVGYLIIGNVGGSNDLGYGIRKEFWHQGIASEASLALINHLRKVEFPFLTATHDINNPNSGGVMKKIGMSYRYSYEEYWQPKNIPVIFRMYQINLAQTEGEYQGYREKYSCFIEMI